MLTYSTLVVQSSMPVSQSRLGQLINSYRKYNVPTKVHFGAFVYFSNRHFVTLILRGLLTLPLATPFTKIQNSRERRRIIMIGSLSNDDGTATRMAKKKKQNKTIGSYWQNNNSARAARFCFHFLAVTARLRRETA